MSAACSLLQPFRDIYTITQDVIARDHNIANIEANPKRKATLGLNVDSRRHAADSARKLKHEAIAHSLYEASTMALGNRLDDSEQRRAIRSATMPASSAPIRAEEPTISPNITAAKRCPEAVAPASCSVLVGSSCSRSRNSKSALKPCRRVSKCGCSCCQALPFKLVLTKRLDINCSARSRRVWMFLQPSSNDARVASTQALRCASSSRGMSRSTRSVHID